VVTNSDWDQFGPDYDQPTYEGRSRTYVIASMPRSGSHMLGHLLHATGQLGSPLEYVHRRHLATWQKTLGEPTRTATLRAIMRRRTSPSGWFGVKTHWPQFQAVLEDAELFAALDVQEWIRITRSDRVAQAVSLVIAQQTQAWISFHEARREPEYDFDAIAAAVRNLAEQESAWDAYFAEQGIEPLTVVYEEMLDDPAAVVTTVCARLGVSMPRPVSRSQTARQATGVNAEWRHRFLAESAGG